MRELTDREKLDFKRKLEELASYKGRATELISLYVPPERQISDVAAYLRDEYGQSSNIKSKSTRKNVTGAIESILSKLKYFSKPPENGVVFFVGHVAKGASQTQMVSFTLEPPDPLVTFLYRCDSLFYIEPLQDMLTEKKSYGLIVMDRSEATIGLLKGKRIHAIKTFESGVMGKHRMGGQSALRFERLIEISAHEYYKKLAGIANDAFLAEPELLGIIIGGPGATKRYFAEKDFLHHELKKKLLDPVDTSYTDEYGLREMVENAMPMLQGMELLQEKRLMKRFLSEVKKTENSLATYGEAHVRQALLMGAVDTLLVSEGLKKRSLQIRCQSCGVVDARIAKGDETEWKCNKCQSPMEVVEEKDLIDEYYEIAGTVGTKVEIISVESSEGDILLKAFGGVAAILRFSVGG